MSPVFRSKLKQMEIKGFTSNRKTFVRFQGVAKTNENHDMFAEKRTKMGCTQRYVSKILRGKENLSLETLCKIESSWNSTGNTPSNRESTTKKNYMRRLLWKSNVLV